MFWDLLATESAPFAIALCVMLFIAFLELVGLTFGLGLSNLVDSVLPDFDVPELAGPELDAPDLEIGDADFADSTNGLSADSASGGPFLQFLAWLCLGKVPALVLLVAFLTSFGLIGLALQHTMFATFGAYLPAAIASIPALIAAMPATRYLGLGLSQLVPKEETEAVSRKRFKGAIATIIRGVAKRGMPAEAKLKDWHGQTHYVLVEPDNDGLEFEAGHEVIILRQRGTIFEAIPLDR